MTFHINRSGGAQTRVNITTRVNADAIRRETRNGREVIIVPSATLPDNVIMNGVRYPADEIQAGFASLNNTHAPLGHPMRGNTFIPAASPEALPAHYCGAWNENVRRENGRVFMDKVIDVEVAQQLDAGKTVLNAIDAGEPIHTSTGLWCNLDDTPDGDAADYNARDLEFDHDAILINEEGAATPEQGVGMLVNKDGKTQEIQVINSMLEDGAEFELEWAIERALDAVERKKKLSVIDRLKTVLTEALSSERNTQTATRKDADMSEKELKSLSDQVNALDGKFDGLGETIANAVTAALKPLTDQLQANADAQKAKEDAELKGYVDTIVNANLMDESTAGELTLTAAKALAGSLSGSDDKAAALNGKSGTGGAEDEFKGYSLNAHLDDKKAA